MSGHGLPRCTATTTGPRHLPCIRHNNHADGHVYDAGDRDDGRHDDHTNEED